MSDEPMLRVRSRLSSNSNSASGRALRLPILVLPAGRWVLALSELFQGWEMVQLANGYETPGRIGDQVSVTPVSGQVFFGTLDAASRTTIHLRDVFFAQLLPQAARGADQDAEPRAPSIVRWKDNEWTQADEMAIPAERIGFMETVGADSRMARFIANARSQLPAIPGGQPNSQNPANGQKPDGSTRSPPPDAPKN
jgi:hypothetical protein